MSVENNMLQLLYQTILIKGHAENHTNPMRL